MKYLVIALCFGIFQIANAAEHKMPKSTPALVKAGEAAYKTNCATCHGDKADGNGPAGGAMNPKPRNLISEPFKAGDKPEQIFETITKGLTGTSMVGFAFIPEKDREAISLYIASLRSKKK